MEAAAPRVERHRLYEDVIAIVFATLFIALGVLIYAKATLLSGGLAGLALLIHYLTGTGFWLIFSLVNLPFYLLAWKRMGAAFTVRTFAAVCLVSLFSRLTPQWVDVSAIDPLYATVIGSGMIGSGLLMLFRHRTGLGGINILAIFLQERFGIRAGWLQLGVDVLILAASLLVLSPDRIVLSVVGAAIVNMMLAINHKPGRYLAVS